MMGWWWYNCVSKCTNQISLPCHECDGIIASAMLIMTTSPVSDRYCGIRGEKLKTHTVLSNAQKMKKTTTTKQWQQSTVTVNSLARHMYVMQWKRNWEKCKSLPQDFKSNKMKEYYCTTIDLLPLQQSYSSDTTDTSDGLLCQLVVLKHKTSSVLSYNLFETRGTILTRFFFL